MGADLYIDNASIVTEEAIIEGGVVVSGGKITQLVSRGTAVEAQEVVDLKGMILLPGIVDSHVHLNEPGRTHWEGYRTGTMAAAAGGITTVVDMPVNSIPSTTSRISLMEKRRKVVDRAVIDYAQWGGLVDNNLDDLEDLSADGVVGLKAFMCFTGMDDFRHVTDDILYAGLKRASELGSLVAVHAENDHLTAYLTRQLQAAGRVDRAAWFEAHPPMEELEAILRASYLAKVTGGRLHILHVTIPEGVEAVASAKQQGAHVSVETCPHYLFFDEEDMTRIGPAAKCGPPLRPRETVNSLWDCVLEGKVDVIGSDHSPCDWAQKEIGLDNIWKAWGGMSGIQQALSVILTEGVHKRGMSLTSIARLMSANPARLIGLYPRKGAILPGSDADLAVVDLDKEWKVTAEQLLYKNKFSAYVGCSFKGKVVRTFVRGVTVFKDGQIMVQPGYGKLLRHERPII